MNSMTGFGTSEITTDSGLVVSVDIHSYNKKHLDVRVQAPHGFSRFEGLLKKTVSNRLARGSVFVKVETVATGTALEAAFRVNKELAAAYKRQAEKLKRRLDLAGDVDVNNILSLPGVVTEETPDSLVSEPELAKVANAAIDALVAMRSAEGDELKKDISARIAALGGLVDKIEPLAAAIPEAQKNRLLSNLGAAGLELSSDDDRVLKEIVIFTDKYDVSEELARLRSHLKGFETMLESEEPVGRSMDFLTQEIQREINTLGTKAAHCGTTPLVVEFKTELEKIREQVQNVE